MRLKRVGVRGTVIYIEWCVMFRSVIVELSTLEGLPEFQQGAVILGTTPRFPMAELDTLEVLLSAGCNNPKVWQYGANKNYC